MKISFSCEPVSSANNISEKSNTHCNQFYCMENEKRAMLEISDSVSNEFRSCYKRSESIEERIDHNQSSTSDAQITAESLSNNSVEQTKVLPLSPDVTLKSLLPLRENPETLSEEEIESKFELMALAFRIDRLTLAQRLESHERQRDVAEQDASNELQILRNSIRNLSQLMIFSSEHMLMSSSIRSLMNELIEKIERNIEVVAKTNLKIASRSELYGAVRQEERFSTAFDVILLHAENLKRLRERERRKLEEANKFISSNGNNSNSDCDHSETHSRRTVRSLSSVVPPQANLIHVRRASVSSIDAFRRVQNGNVNAINARYVTSNSNRCRRVSMPASPITMQYYTKNINESSGELSAHLEITAEENCDCDSECYESPEVVNKSEKSEHIITDNETMEEQLVDNKLNDAMSDMNSNQTNISNNIENQKQAMNQYSDHLSSTSLRSVNDYEKHTRKPFEFHNLSDVMNNYYYKHGISDCFHRIVVSLNCQQLRLMLAIILLISAVIIVIFSFMSHSNVVPHYEWRNTVFNIFSRRLSKEKVGQTRQ